MLTDEFGFDAAINYKTDDVPTAIAAACPDGVDVFFDNVGGDILEAALGNLAMRGRVVLCGAISQYNDETPRPGPNNLMNLVINRGRMEGFIILDYMDRAMEAMIELGGWVMEGKLVVQDRRRRGSRQRPRGAEPPVHRRQPRQGDRQGLRVS